MIDAVILQNNGSAFGVHAKNHGDPIVCAAVSMLMTNFVNSLEELTDAGFKIDVDDGDMSVEITEYDRKGFAKLLLDSLILGLRAISSEYPNEINIHNREV